MPFEGHETLNKQPSFAQRKAAKRAEARANAEDAVWEDIAATSESPEVAEDVQHFVLDDKEGMMAFVDFLQKERAGSDALDPDLAIAELDWPEDLVADLKKLRLEFNYLLRMAEDATQLDSDVMPEDLADSVVDQYQAYINADEQFATAYKSYEAEDGADEPATDSSTEEQVVEGIDLVGSAEQIDTIIEIVNLKQEIEADYADIKHTYDTIKGQFPFGKWSAAVQEVFDELDRQRKSALQIVEKLNEAYSDVYDDEATTLLKLQAYARSIEKIKNEVDSYVEDQATQEIIFAAAKSATDSAREAESGDAIDSATEEKSAESAEPLVLKLEQRVDVESEVEKNEANVEADFAQERILQAYKNLENFMIDHEGEYLKVCGMSIPQAGPEGVFAARRFRDGLELAKRNHPELKNSPDKQEIADKIIRTLFVVPAAGLSQEQVDRVAELAKDLQVDSRIIEAESIPESTTQDSVAEDSIKNDAVDSTSADTKETDEQWTPEGKSMETIARHYLGGEPQEKPNSIESEEEYLEGPEQRMVFRSTRKMQVEADPADDGAVKITVRADESDAEDNKAGINHALPTNAERSSNKKEVLNNEALTNKYLVKNPKYKNFLQEVGISASAFEKKLQSDIAKIDAQAIDSMERYLDRPYNSAFSFLQDLSIQDIAQLNALPYNQRKGRLTNENIKYEAYQAWMDVFSSIPKSITATEKTKFGELFAKWMIETEMTYYEGGTDAGQFTL